MKQRGSVSWVILLVMAWIFLMLIWLFFSALRAECAEHTIACEYPTYLREPAPHWRVSPPCSVASCRIDETAPVLWSTCEGVSGAQCLLQFRNTAAWGPQKWEQVMWPFCTVDGSHLPPPWMLPVGGNGSLRGDGYHSTETP